jgi:hypothetical protein
MKPNREKEEGITRDFLLDEMYDYNREAGKLYHRKSRGKARKGDEVGYVNPTGYRVTMIKKRIYLIHRLIWVIENGSFPDNMIDHINRNKDDNRITNLRDVNCLENLLNKDIFIQNGGVRTPEYKREYQIKYQREYQQNKSPEQKEKENKRHRDKRATESPEQREERLRRRNEYAREYNNKHREEYNRYMRERRKKTNDT